MIWAEWSRTSLSASDIRLIAAAVHPRALKSPLSIRLTSLCAVIARLDRAMDTGMCRRKVR